MTERPITSRRHRTRWRRLPAITALALAAAALGAGSASAAGTQAAAAQAAFPVTITHKFGSTTITAKPTRIVVVGLLEQDALLALGEVPVADTEWFGAQKGALFPWALARLGKAKLPTVLKNTDGFEFEKIKALHPDVIIGLYSGMKKSDYQTLSKIAPTVAQSKDYVDYGVPWQVATRTVGAIVGKSAQAQALVLAVQKRFVAVRAANPSFAGASAVVAAPYQGTFVYGPQDVRSRVLQSLGFKMPDDLGGITGTSFGANLSKERTDLLDVDAIVWLLGEDVSKDASALAGDPLYASLKVHTEGREVLLGSKDPVGNAYSFVTVLSLPYLLDNLVPMLRRAVDGNPATAVRAA